MKKELSLAALLLISPSSSVFAKEVAAVRQEFSVQAQAKASFEFIGTQTFMYSRDIRNDAGDVVDQKMVEHKLVLSFVPLKDADSLFNLFAIGTKKTEFEVLIKYVPVNAKDNKKYGYFDLDRSYYGFQSNKNKIVVYDCDSSYVCRNKPETISVFKLLPNNQVKLVKQGEGFVMLGDQVDFTMDRKN